MIEPLDTEISSIRQMATMFISSDTDYKLPKELHDMLNNIFTKTNRSGTQTIQFRKAVVTVTNNFNNNAKHEIIRGRTAAIYNALCLYAIIGTAETKKLFQHYYQIQQVQKKQNFDVYLKKLTDKDLSTEMMFFGVSVKSFNEIKSALCCEKFSLFTDKLPSPFGSLDNPHDLTPLIILCDQDVNWPMFVELYNDAEACLKRKFYDDAKNALLKIDDIRLLNLPIVQKLKSKIDADVAENQEAWDYLQNLLK